MKRFIFYMCLILSIALGLFSCGGNGDGETTQYTVSVITTSGAEVTSTNPLKVDAGESAVFDIKLSESCVFRSVSAGSYDIATGKLTVSNVTSDMRIDFVAEVVNETAYIYRFYGTEKDTSSLSDGKYSDGTSVTVKASSETRTFEGWTVGGYKTEGYQIVSTDKEYTFTVSASLVDENMNISVYANYKDRDSLYYDRNGGGVVMSSDNLSATKYYTATETQNGVKVTYKSEYIDAVGCASTFYDDGSFTRSGYVLMEYNTKADGSGESYSLGSKFPMNLEATTLYCIWAKDTAHTDFEYANLILEKPSGARDISHWLEEGIVITAYNGNDKTVTVPEKIDGKYVTAIAENAFVGKSVETLVLSRRILKIEDGAFKNCASLNTIYYPDGIYYIGNGAFDTASWSGVKNFYVNATIAPRFTADGYAIKLTRLLNSNGKSRIIVIAGSSTYQGLSSAYLESLLDGEYTVINFGTTRTTQGAMYLEAMGELATDDDVILYAPENSIYMLGEPRLYWKTLRDLEGMYNIFRHIDISGYENVLGAFGSLNRGDTEETDPLETGRYFSSAIAYEDIIKVTHTNEYGEYQLPDKRGKYVVEENYGDYYNITLNERVKSILEGHYSNSKPSEEDPYTSDKWCSLTDSKYKDSMNRAITAAKSSGAKIYFSFAPADADKIYSQAKADISSWCTAYDTLIKNTYVFDGIVGSSKNYIYDHVYFYNNAFHPNDYGRTWRTYTLYSDLCTLFGITSVKHYNAVGTDFEGCLFELVMNDSPKYAIDY